MADQTTDTHADVVEFGDHRFANAYERGPVPHVPDNTLYFDAGAVRIGVEYRLLTLEVLTTVYGADRAGEILAEQLGNGSHEPNEELGDAGVSIHVFDAATMTEHLRFDDLDELKHYHYLTGRGPHAVVWFDHVANGELIPWVLSSLRDRLIPMLELAGATELAERVDPEAVARILPDVAEAARAQAVQPAS